MAQAKARFDKGASRRINPEYIARTRGIRDIREKIERRRNRGDDSEVPALLGTIRELEKERAGLPCSDSFDPNYRRLLYCRYADDFIIGIIGSKEDARTVTAEVGAYLADNLKLQVSGDKSGVHKASEGAGFLGDTVRTYRSLRLKRVPRHGRTVTARAPSDFMQLHIPNDKLARFVERKRLGHYHSNRGEMRADLQDNSDAAIVGAYNALMRGLAEYYKLGNQWKRELDRVHRIWWWSLHKILARKHKCWVARIAARLRHGDRKGLWYERAGTRRFMAVYRLADTPPNPTRRPTVDRLPQESPSRGGDRRPPTASKRASARPARRRERRWRSIT